MKDHILAIRAKQNTHVSLSGDLGGIQMNSRLCSKISSILASLAFSCVGDVWLSPSCCVTETVAMWSLTWQPCNRTNRSIIVSVRASPDSNSDSMGESQPESGFELFPTLTLPLWTRTPPLWTQTQALWTPTLVSWTQTRTPRRWTRTHSESRWFRWEMYKANLNFMCNNGQNMGKKLIKLLN